jgi:hypothetical protein
MKIYFFNFFDFFLKFREKSGIFITGSISYSVNLQLDIMQNSWKNMWGTHKYF